MSAWKSLQVTKFLNFSVSLRLTKALAKENFHSILDIEKNHVQFNSSFQTNHSAPWITCNSASIREIPHETSYIFLTIFKIRYSYFEDAQFTYRLCDIIFLCIQEHNHSKSRSDCNLERKFHCFDTESLNMVSMDKIKLRSLCNYSCISWLRNH